MNPRLFRWFCLAAAVAGAQPARFTATGPLDDPAAQPGQIIVAGSKPGYLKYNGGGPAYLAGPDDPEAFFFLGKPNPDGTRSGGPQDEIIDRLARAGVSAFHAQMFRMRRCNFKKEGDDTHTPFRDHDPAKGLNPAILNQWDGWLEKFEKAGIAVHLEFYNDATDVALMGWALDARANLHPDEERFITGIVNRFKHRKNILWGIEESANKLHAARTPYFKKLADIIARTDNHRHPIVQSLVIPNDPENDFPPGGVLSDAYYGHPHMHIVTWLHLVPHGDDIDMQHREYLSYWKRDSAHFIVMKNETYWRPYLQTDPLGRRYFWSATMAGLHNLEAQVKADRAAHEPRMRELGYIARFIEQTDYHRMKPDRTLAAGSTRWVLANPDSSYIAYADAYGKPVGVKDLKPGTFDLLWLDTVGGNSAWQRGVKAAAAGGMFEKPAGFGNEVAVYIKRL